VLLVSGGAVAACSSEPSSAPVNPGDTLYVDVEAGAPPPSRSSDADTDPDGVFAPVDGSGIYGSGIYDASAYAVLSICMPADASAGSSASDGGGGKNRKDAGAGDGSEAGADFDAGYSPTDGGYLAGDAGCEPFPASCTSQTDVCACLLGTLAAQIPCPYPHCAANSKRTAYGVYCPP
jgi:hypothetical protein